MIILKALLLKQNSVSTVRQVRYLYILYGYGHQVLYMYLHNRMAGVMDSVLASSAIDRAFELRPGHTKDY